MKIYCERCKSEDVEMNVRETPRDEERVSIEDYAGPSVIVDLVYRPTTYTVKCKVCGNSKEITH